MGAMDEAKFTSLLVGALVLISLPYLWRHRSQFPTLFMFFNCYYIFVVIGLVLMPWWRHVLGGSVFIGKYIYIDLGTYVDMSLFDTADYTRALEVVSVGLIAAALGYRLVNFLQPVSRKVVGITRDQNQEASQVSDNALGFGRSRCFYLTAIVTFIVTVLIASRGSAVFSGLNDGLLAGSHESYIQARLAVSSNNYVSYVMICNVLPFFAVATWIAESRSSELNWRIWARFIVLITTLYQLCIFQKRPAIVFLCMIIAATFLFSTQVRATKRTPVRWLSLGLSGGAVTTFLMLLYYCSTSVRHVAENWFEAIVSLFLISFTRIVGRLSWPSLWYAHYFPKIDEHYGISNIGLLAKICGYEPYYDTVDVFFYVTGNPSGSGAICAIVDFYGGFGWLGCMVGGLLIGGFLAFMDIKIHGTNFKGAKILLTVFACVFAYYLSQSSIFRASLGYGGLFFIISWILLGACFRKKIQHQINRNNLTLQHSPAHHSRNMS